jgi:two-component system response regulator (stage 0 sporulation protein A)
MKKNIRIIVADDNTLVREMLVDGIADQKDFEILATASNGRETIELIKEYEPDVVLLDLVMPIVDGLGVMEAVREDNNGKVPYFIIVSAAGKEDIVTQALDSGASYFFMKPFDEGALIRRIRQLCDSEPKKSIAESSYVQNDTSYSVENETSSLIRKLGIPAKMIGYKYAIDAIMITLEEPDAIVSITKDIYSKIGERYGTSPTNVERNIRYGIETAWSKRQHNEDPRR